MLAFLRRTGLKRGILGGNRVWMVIGVIAWSLRLLSWAWKRKEEVVFLEEMRVGDSFLITKRAATGRRRSKRT